MDFDIWNPAHRGACHALYRRLREEDPVHRAVGPLSGHPYWFLTRHADVTKILRDPRVGVDVDRAIPDIRTRPQSFAFRIFVGTMLGADPPVHTRLRGLVEKAFVPGMVEGLRPRIEEAAARLAAPLLDGGAHDVIADFAVPLPMSVLAYLLGVPEEDHERFRTWSQAMMMLKSKEAAKEAFRGFQGYFQGLVAERTAHPGTDLVSMLVRAEEGGERLTEREIIASIGFLVSTGHETVSNFLGNALHLCAEHPEIVEQLDADDGLWPTALEEMLRLDGAVECALARYVYEDFELEGRTLRRGDAVIAGLLAANRDPAVFDRPDEVDLRRKPNRHLSFGGGVHYCLGARLARIEGEVALRAVLEGRKRGTLPRVADPSAVRWIAQSGERLGMHGLAHFPVRFD